MKRHMTTSILSVMLAAALIVPLSACGAKEQPLEQEQQVQGGGNTSTNEQDSGEITEPTDAETSVNTEAETNTDADVPAPTKEQISVYYTDDDMAALHEQKSDIEYADPEQKLAAVWLAIQADGANGEASLWKGVQLLSAKQDGTAVTLDLHIPDEARLGAPGEMLALQSLTRTFFQLPDIASIDVLVDGEAVDSLMGHEELEHPINKP
ncbi:GerMN domain-containing protein [Paenibacillus silvisoli]|uniref:GerMN domain-containing protein n=1 Tax=Paenibacillus silvisoli TaxID=3110539 RepID=UPI002805CDC0|nr:GerMN domain-containing protein [Paenibacillus silvisoli]